LVRRRRTIGSLTILGAAIARPELKKHWAPSERAFRRFLNWLDEGIDSSGERYLEMRRRLESYFERRHCRAPDELADETLNRVTRRLEEEGTIAGASPAHYCYIVAKFVFQESIRKANAVVEVAADETVLPGAGPDAGVGHGASEKLLDRLEECLQKLSDADRQLILEYYRGEQRVKIERRHALAARLGLTMNALSIRACRVRDRLETCIKTRLAANDAFS
jgi:DNA-directed RNA polymerase specialized sigma24 family protein